MYKVIKILCLMICACFVACATLSAPLPKGQKGAQAEQLAQKVLTALNAQAFFAAEGATWQFRDHHYVWHKTLNRVRLQLEDELFVYVDLNLQKGWAFEAQQRLEPKAESEAVKKAIKAFNNDSFWAFAPFKINDLGTQRALVKSLPAYPADKQLNDKQSTDKQLNDKHTGTPSLLVFYESGGSTPGDHYLWHLDQQYRPYEWQMWVSIIPIGGTSSRWAQWKQTKSGAWVAQEHNLSFITFEVKNIEVVTHFEELGIQDSKLVDTWPKDLSF